jgi:hypothetical protein
MNYSDHLPKHTTIVFLGTLRLQKLLRPNATLIHRYHTHIRHFQPTNIIFHPELRPGPIILCATGRESVMYVNDRPPPALHAAQGRAYLLMSSCLLLSPRISGITDPTSLLASPHPPDKMNLRCYDVILSSYAFTNPPSNLLRELRPRSPSCYFHPTRIPPHPTSTSTRNWTILCILRSILRDSCFHPTCTCTRNSTIL